MISIGGEYQPRVRRDGKPDGEVIRGSYSAVGTEDDWLAARAEAAERRKNPWRGGGDGRHVNAFKGLLYNADDGGTFFACTRPRPISDWPCSIATSSPTSIEGRPAEGNLAPTKGLFLACAGEES